MQLYIDFFNKFRTFIIDCRKEEFTSMLLDAKMHVEKKRYYKAYINDIDNSCQVLSKILNIIQY